MTPTPLEERVSALLRDIAAGTPVPTMSDWREWSDAIGTPTARGVGEPTGTPTPTRRVSRRSVLVGGVSAATAACVWLWRRRHDTARAPTAKSTPTVVDSAPATTSVSTITPRTSAVVLVGDSFAEALKVALAALGYEVEDHIKVSSGLARPDFYDWTAAMGSLLATLAAGVPVVFVIGSNDAQSLTRRDGTLVAEFGTPEWSVEHRTRLAAIADLVAQHGHPLIWVGLAQDGRPETNHRFAITHQATSEAFQSHEGVRLVDPWTILAGPDGDYATTINNDDGVPTVIRQSDEYHLTAAGAALLAAHLDSALQKTR